MKRFAAVCWLLAALPTASWGRIGESLDQCIDRYGPVIEKRQPELPQSDPAAAVFSKNGVTVIVEFRGDLAWRVTFRKPKLIAAELDALLAANSAAGTWSTALRYGDNDFRLASDNKRLAVTRLTPGNEISQVDIMLREYAQQRHANLPARSTQTGPTDASKPKTNPLPGF